MYARVMRFEIKPDKIDDMHELAKEIIPDELDKIKGLREFISLVRDDGKIMNISIFETQP